MRSDNHAAVHTRPPHPIVYAVLIVPFGATNGFVTVALAFLATKAGLTVEQRVGTLRDRVTPGLEVPLRSGHTGA